MIKDVYPSRSGFKKGEQIEIILEIEGVTDRNKLRCNVFKLHENILTVERNISSSESTVKLEFEISNVEGPISGYGVEVELYEEDKKVQALSTAFDILDSWKYAPRYGFLSDFDKLQLDDDTDIAELNKYHINIVQFYDWMYRHHELLPPQSDFIDAMGRSLSLDVVRQKIEAAKKYRMRTMAYGAVYGAETEFYNEAKELALLQNDGKVMSFIEFIYFMDINRESPWHDHIIKEFRKALEFGFDGIHMDQYGYPKEAWVKKGQKYKLRHLRRDFPELIEDTRKYIEEDGCAVDLIFNAVNNWPIDTVAASPQDCMYIEVWPPNETFEDLNRLIANAKRYAPQKQVILAAYLKPFLEKGDVERKQAENGALLTMATIFSSGGFHLLLGEKNGILTEAYYPTYAVNSSKEFTAKLRNYYDFIVRYEELLYSSDIVDNTLNYTGGINGEYVFKGAGFSVKAEKRKVWTQIKEKEGAKIIQLVNFTGIYNMNWNEGKASLPQTVMNIEVTALVVEKVKGVYLASPDNDLCSSIELEFTTSEHSQGKAIQFTVSELNVWNLIYILVDEDQL